MGALPTAVEARAVGIVADRWPYGPNANPETRRPLVEWAKAGGLRYSPHGRCLHWISRGRCAVSQCNDGPHRRHWMDHVTGWTRDGAPAVLVAQPYGLTVDDLRDLADVDERWQLDVRVDGTGWYGFGTTFVELWAQPRSRWCPVRERIQH